MNQQSMMVCFKHTGRRADQLADMAELVGVKFTGGHNIDEGYALYGYGPAEMVPRLVDKMSQLSYVKFAQKLGE